VVGRRQKNCVLTCGQFVPAFSPSSTAAVAAAVVAEPDGRSGEVAAAFVVKRDPSLTEPELRAFCAEQLTAYTQQKRIEFRATLPKTPVGKILRRALRDEARRLAGG